MEWLDEVVQPRCPDDLTVLVVSGDSFLCRNCGYREELAAVQHPGEGTNIIDLR